MKRKLKQQVTKNTFLDSEIRIDTPTFFYFFRDVCFDRFSLAFPDDVTSENIGFWAPRHFQMLSVDT